MKTILATHNPDLARDFDRDLLRRRDLRLVMARTMAEVVERAQAGVDLVFVDRVLPDGDAETLLQTFAEDKRLARLPVVLVIGPGHPPGPMGSAARARGFADVVELPSPPGALPLLLARHLGMSLRANERFAVRVNVFDQHSSGDYLGTSIDLSERGLLLRARRAVDPGTVVHLRFALPGRAGELAPHARVVRCQPSDGAWLVALELTDLDPPATAALREYLRMLVGQRPFSWQVTLEGGRQVIALYGVLRADSDLGPLASLRGEVAFRLREFRRISSDSVQKWMALVASLTHVTRIALLECPIAFIHQANLIPTLLERQQVESLYAPYVCEACGLEEERLVDVARDLDGGKRKVMPQFPCSACAHPLTFDELVETYLAFL